MIPRLKSVDAGGPRINLSCYLLRFALDVRERESVCVCVCVCEASGTENHRYDLWAIHHHHIYIYKVDIFHNQTGNISQISCARKSIHPYMCLPSFLGYKSTIT